METHMFDYNPGEITGEENPYALKDIASYTNDERDLEVLSEIPNSYIQSAVASNPHTPTHVLIVLASHENSYIRRAVAFHPNSDAAILRSLAADENAWVRQALVSRADTPLDVLTVLSTDENPYVLRLVGKHPAADETVLHAVAVSGFAYAQYQVARHMNTSDETLHLLHEVGNEWVLYALSANPHAPAEIRSSTKLRAAVRKLRAQWAAKAKLNEEQDHTETAHGLVEALPNDDDLKVRGSAS